ncbi:MAG: DNA-3-methyladenine glycosylase family protein [Terriglobia bacterium]
MRTPSDFWLVVMLLETRSPFDFRRTLRFVLSPPALRNGREFAPLLDHYVEGEFRRAAEVNGAPVLYAVSESGPRPGGPLKIRILAGPNDLAAITAVAEMVRRQFSTGLDVKPFYRLATTDHVLSRLVMRFRGMRIPQAGSAYEALISAIIEQQVNISFAHQVKRALIGAYGRSIDYQGRRYHTFPEPGALASTTPEALLRLQVSGPKARYIITISEAISSGALDLETLRGLAPEAAREKLIALKGVGEWTAHYVGLRALGHLDCLPAADVGLQKTIHFFYRLRKQPGAARVERLARPWAGWRSYATFYLWLTYWEDPQWKAEVLAEINSLRREANRSLARSLSPAPS